jgi:hypothetical protein
MMEVKSRGIFPPYLIFKPKRTSKENKLELRNQASFAPVIIFYSYAYVVPVIFISFESKRTSSRETNNESLVAPLAGRMPSRPNFSLNFVFQ